MSPAFKRDMLFLLFVALSCLGAPWNLPVVLMGAVAVARWNAASADTHPQGGDVKQAPGEAPQSGGCKPQRPMNPAHLIKTKRRKN